MSQASPPAPDEIVTVMDIVDTLEELLGGARRLPFTPSVVVNEEEILELVDRIRVALPDDLQSARHTLDERDRMLDRAERDAAELSARTERETTDLRAQAGRDAADLRARAQQEAERAVREAQAQATALVQEHAIVRAATEQAGTTVGEAERHAAAQRSAADDYARDVMQRLEEQLGRWLGTVREGLQSLPQPEAPARGRRKR